MIFLQFVPNLLCFEGNEQHFLVDVECRAYFLAEVKLNLISFRRSASSSLPMTSFEVLMSLKLAA